MPLACAVTDSCDVGCVLRLLRDVAAMSGCRSFYYIGSSVEEQMGTLVAFGQTLLFTPLIGLLYLLLEYVAAQVMQDDKYLYSCAVGFSGVIFAFVIVDTGLSMRQGVRTRR